MKLVKKIIFGALIGIGVGYLTQLLFSFIYGVYSPAVPSYLHQFSSPLKAVALETLAFAVLGVLQNLASLIMAQEDWGLARRTVLHFACVVLPLLLVAYGLHWSRNLLGLLIIGLCAALIYALIWLAIYLRIKSNLERINRSLARRG